MESVQPYSAVPSLILACLTELNLSQQVRLSVTLSSLLWGGREKPIHYHKMQGDWQTEDFSVGSHSNILPKKPLKIFQSFSSSCKNGFFVNVSNILVSFHDYKC